MTRTTGTFLSLSRIGNGSKHCSKEFKSSPTFGEVSVINVMRDIIHHGLRMKGFCLSFFTLTGLFYGWRARGQKFLRRGYSSHSKVFNANKWKNREIIPQSMSNRNGNSVDGIDLLPVETIIEIQKIAKLLFRRCFAAVVVDGLPWVQEIFSRVRRGASWAAGRHVFSLRPKTRAAKLREKTSGTERLD